VNEVSGTANGIERAAQAVAAMRTQIGKAVVGQAEVVDQVLAGLIAGGHVLIEGVPGLGKTLLVQALARTFSGSYRRIQFTPDLMPADVCGHTLYDQATRQFTTRRGPVFTHLLLAEEINRAPAKTQAALLEVMQEGQVTIEGTSLPLEAPFMVLATQNPREYEGTYPLPESQLDRFLLRIRIGYPGAPDEKAILRGAAVAPESLTPALTDAEVLALQGEVERVRADESVLDYLMAVVTATRKSPLLALGVSPRGSLALLRAAQAAALADGRDYLLPDDVKGLAVAALAHRVIARNGSGGGEPPRLDAEAVIRAILHDVPVPR
jgi:MoxR-like ATPase